jgi:hypothetical protein
VLLAAHAALARETAMTTTTDDRNEDVLTGASGA